jgi:hypothetical protein
MSTQPRTEIPYNPLDKVNLARSLEEALLQRPMRSLPSPRSHCIMVLTGNGQP